MSPRLLSTWKVRASIPSTVIFLATVLVTKALWNLSNPCGCDLHKPENILEWRKVEPVEKKLTQYKQNYYIVLAGWKILDTQNKSLTIHLSEEKNLDDH
jgi:hypothetical protein